VQNVRSLNLVSTITSKRIEGSLAVRGRVTFSEGIPARQNGAFSGTTFTELGVRGFKFAPKTNSLKDRINLAILRCFLILI
jgi:hypothetical protein